MSNIRLSAIEFQSECDEGKVLTLIAVPDTGFDRRVILADCVVVV